MENFKVALSVQGTEAVVEAHSININFQPTMNGDALSEGNLSITGKQTLSIVGGQKVDVPLNQIDVRLAELEALLPTMPIRTNEEKAIKAKTQAKFDIWKVCLVNVQNAFALAIVANYELENVREAV